MAIFETGGVANVNELADVIRAFSLSNGWTVNHNAAEGAGRRIHLQRGVNTFINLRSLVNEQAQNDGVNFHGLMSGIACNGSTGYDASKNWFNQPTAPKRDNNPFPYYFMPGMVNLTGGIPAYYLFARGDMIYCVIEYAAGLYQWLGFGQVVKHGAWNGGTLIFGSHDAHTNDNNAIYTTLFGNVPWGLSFRSTSGNPNGLLYGTIDGNTGWMLSDANNNIQPQMPRFFSTECVQSGMAINLANQYNSQPVEQPINVHVTRDGLLSSGQWNANHNWSIEGLLPDVYMACLRSLQPGDIIPVSIDDYRVFPFRGKTPTGFGLSGWHGFAIKQN